MDISDKTRFLNELRCRAADLADEGVGALGGLYDLAAPRLFRYAVTLTRHRDDAEDALQAAMVRIALKPRALARADNPWAYFLRVLRNEVFNLARRRRPAQTLTDLTELGITDPPTCEQAELHALVREAVHRLPPNQAEVVVLKVWEGMTFADIAEVLRESPNTIASRYRYALDKLSQILQPRCEESFP